MQEHRTAVEGYLTGISMEFQRCSERIAELEEEVVALQEENMHLREELETYREEPTSGGLFQRLFRKKTTLSETEAQTNPLDTRLLREALEEEPLSAEDAFVEALEERKSDALYETLIAYLETNPEIDALLHLLKNHWQHVDVKSLSVFLTLLSDETVHCILKNHRETWTLLRQPSMEVQNQWRGAKHLFLLEEESAALHLRSLLDTMFKTGRYKSLRTKERNLFGEMLVATLHVGLSENTADMLLRLSKDEADLLEELMTWDGDEKKAMALRKILTERSWDNRRETMESTIYHRLTQEFLSRIEMR